MDGTLHWHQDKRWLAEQAGRSLAAMLGHDEDGAALAVLDVTARHGMSGVLFLLCAWVDQMVRRCFPQVHQHPELLAGFRAVDVQTGEAAEIDELTPDERWAGRWIQARATMDRDNQLALWQVLEANLDGASACIRLVLIGVCVNLAAAAGAQIVEGMDAAEWFGGLLPPAG